MVNVSSRRGGVLSDEPGTARTPVKRSRPLLCAVLLSLCLIAARAYASECVDCHPPGAKSSSWKSTHDPFKEQDCTSCHKEHGSRGELLLTEEGNALCAACHEAGDKSLVTAHRQMPVDKLSCLSCHHPHASERGKLLRPNIHRPLVYGECQDCHREDGKLRASSVALLCFRCHEARAFQGVSRHEPVAKGKCGDCHDPHGSPRPLLLTGAYSLERYVPFREEAYELCLNCHESESFTDTGTDADTGFKDSRDNLHYRHVGKRGTSATGTVSREGITCRNCHLPHASLQQHLIRENLDCGQGVLCLRLAYALKDGVGTCTAGCHKSASYTAAKDAQPWIPVVAAEPSPRRASEVPSPSQPTAFESACVGCHADDWARFQKKNLHDPVRKKRCGECHMDHREDNKLLLLGYEGSLCAGCHSLDTAIFRRSHGGLDVRDSHCLRCHDPHSSDRKGLLHPVSHEPFNDRACGDCHDSGSASWTLSRPVKEVCADCHEDQIHGTYLHGAISKNTCVGCHEPHAARWQKLLAEQNPELCYRCHGRQAFSREFRHEPVDSGECDSCHNVHGAEQPNLLIEAYPVERYLEFVQDRYKLCFACHEADPFREDGNTGTAFRDGRKNLHFMHVNGRQTRSAVGKKLVAGTTCRNCHDPHSTDQPNLIRQELDCGGVPCLNLDFRKAGEQARCSRGCHTPAGYSPK